MLPIVANVPNHYFFEAETAISARVAPPQEVRKFLEENSDVLMDLLARVYRGVDGIMGRLAQLMAGSARSRLLYELVMVSKRFGVERPNGVFVSFHETDLAEQAGLQRETVSRELANLKRVGMVSVTRAGITVRDIAEIEAELAQALRN
jgi:CRP-like cAMP-binding protein